MKRRIIEIDQDKCNGCGACAAACHEGAIAMVDGKAKLMRDDYCDGLGDCLPTCPTGAIRFVEREAAAYDEQAVLANKQKKMQKEGAVLHHGCPGMQLRTFAYKATQEAAAPTAQESQLSQWPVQIRLIPVNAPYFSGAKRQTARRMPMPPSMRSSSRGISRLSAARSSTAWITAKSSPRSSRETISKA